ncbi:MAG: flagellar motor switch protein FliN [Treponema sp.]|nr:MAG: flagellar motor switch protein FliN [Treponema sp.]
MSDGSISQDEIDALLSGIDMGGGGASGTSSSAPEISDFKAVGVKKFLDSTVPGLKANLESMTGKTVVVVDPGFELNNREMFLQNIPEMAVVTTIDFSSGLPGDHVFVLSVELAEKIVSLVNHEEKAEIDDMALSVISEVVSNYVSAEITALDGFGLGGVANQPAESVSVPKAMIRLPQKEFPVFKYDITIDNDNYAMWEVMTDGAFSKIIEAIQGPEPEVNSTMNQNTSQQPTGGYNGGAQLNQGTNMGQMNMGQQAQAGGFGANPNIQPVAFPPLQNVVTEEEQGNIGLIMDVYMELTVELGRTKRMVKEILGMGEGHIIALDKLAGENVDILVNHKPIAKGEVVVIDENFGVRVTEILSPSERMADIT